MSQAVTDGIHTHVAHVQPTRGIREHGQHVELVARRGGGRLREGTLITLIINYLTDNVSKWLPVYRERIGRVVNTFSLVLASHFFCHRSSTAAGAYLRRTGTIRGGNGSPTFLLQQHGAIMVT